MKEFVRFLLILVYALGLISSRGFTRCLLNCSEGIYRLARIRRSLVTSLYRCPEVSIFPRAEWSVNYFLLLEMGACEAVPIASRVERIHVPKRIVLLSSWKKLPAFHLSFGVSFDWDNVTICLWHSCVTEARSKYPSNHNHSSKSVSRQIRCRRYHEVQLIRQALPARIQSPKSKHLRFSISIILSWSLSHSNSIPSFTLRKSRVRTFTSPSKSLSWLIFLGNISVTIGCTEDIRKVIIYGDINAVGDLKYHAKVLAFRTKVDADTYAASHGRLPWPGTKTPTWAEHAQSGQQSAMEAALRSLLTESIRMTGAIWVANYYPPGKMMIV